MTDRFDVVINGGGPVGMGLAIELAQRGVSVCVVERYPQPQPIPKGQNLTQRTCEHFAAWNCEARIRTAHPLPPEAGTGGMTMYGTILSDYALDWFNRGAVGAYYHTRNARLPQYKTESVLRERAAELDKITLMYGWEGRSLTQDAEGVTLTIGQPGAQDTASVRGSYLVGTDGSRSMVRQAASITETRRDHDRLMALLVFSSPELHSLLERHPGKAIYKVLHPDQDGYWMFFGRVDHGESWFFHAPVPPGTTTENYDFRAFLHRAVGQDFALDLTYVGFWDLRIAYANDYRAGRVFIAGDAAHSHPPYGGYGINTGLEDARNLGWKLAATVQGWGGGALLDSYSAERQPVFASTARDFIERYIEKDRTFLRNHRPDEGESAFRKAWIESQSDTWDVDAFRPNYAGSPIVAASQGHPSAVGAHDFCARVGHHLPPAGPDGRDVAAALAPGFTLLTGDGDTARVFADQAAALGIPLTAPAAREGWFDPLQARAVLVRPDGFVAWTGDGADADVARRALLRAAGHGTGGSVATDTSDV